MMIRSNLIIKAITPVLLSIFLCFMMSGCAGIEVAQGPSKPTTVSDSLKVADYENADDIIEAKSADQPANDKILYYFDKGSILQIMGKYKES